MDLTESIAPKSDQLNADDLISGPRTFTIERVSKGSSEQPVNVVLLETPGRPYRPSKSMRRVLVSAWGKEADVYAGRRITLYRDEDVKFGGERVGGIKISHLSGIDRPVTLSLTVTRGKKAPHTVQPLPDNAPTAAVEPSADEISAITNLDELRALYPTVTSETVKGLIADRAAVLTAEAEKKRGEK